MSEGDTRNSTERIPLTKEIADFIDAEIRRSGISPARFMREYANGGNLSAHKIWKWRRHKSKTILKSDLDEFMASWGAFPDVAPRIELTSKHVQALQAEQHRTGVSATGLPKQASWDQPSGLNASLISSWLGKHV